MLLQKVAVIGDLHEARLLKKLLPGSLAQPERLYAVSKRTSHVHWQFFCVDGRSFVTGHDGASVYG